MTTRNIKVSGKRLGGFSLIEVMIAVLVLATGLMAMAALQATLVRNSADAKARSQVVAFIDRVFDAQRATPYDNIPLGDSVTTLVSTADITALQNSTGVTNVAVTARSRRIVGGARTGAPTSWFPYSELSAAEKLKADEESLPEYKEIDLTVTWKDATGGDRTLGMTTIASPIALGSSTLLNTLPNDGGAAILPVVRTDNPAGEGVIPIAVGDNRDTAATNPKPKLDSEGGVISTRFDVLTYANESTDARIQRRVETEIVNCLCQYGAPPPDSDVSPVFKVVVRPTYWNGKNYVEPAEVFGTEGTGDAIKPSWSALDRQGDPVKEQSPFCNDCCRDHHDEATVDVEFDPFRTDEHRHFLADDIVADPDTAVPVDTSSGIYNESCRLIRVNGLKRVATDLNLEHMNLLKTAQSSTSSFDQSDFIPEKNASDNYAKFVVDYLAARVVPIGQDNTVDVDGLMSTYQLNEPALLEISTDSRDHRFAHDRGLYIDHLEKDAIEELQEQLDECNTSGIECILANIPFLTINTTELAEWNALDPATGDEVENKLRVTDGQGTFFTLGGAVPNRGELYAGDAGQPKDEINADARLKKSNTGLVIARPIDHDTAKGTGDSDSQNDAQRVVLAGDPPPTAVPFVFQLDIGRGVKYDNASEPMIVTNFVTQAACTNPPSNPPTFRNDDKLVYACSTPIASAPSTRIVLSGYNRVNSVTKQTNPCPGATADKITLKVCANYKITVKQGGTIPTIGGTTGTQGRKSEATFVDLAALADGDRIIVEITDDTPATVPSTMVCSGATYVDGTCD